MGRDKQQANAFIEQFALGAVLLLESGFPRVNSDQARRTRSVLMVASAQRENEAVRSRLGATVNVVDGNQRIEDAVLFAGDASKLRNGVVKLALGFGGG